jgi:hypothetical protein
MTAPLLEGPILVPSGIGSQPPPTSSAGSIGVRIILVLLGHPE